MVLLGEFFFVLRSSSQGLAWPRSFDTFPLGCLRRWRQDSGGGHRAVIKVFFCIFNVLGSFVILIAVFRSASGREKLHGRIFLGIGHFFCPAVNLFGIEVEFF